MKKTHGKRPLTAVELAECAALKAIYNAKKKVLQLAQDELGERLGGISQSGVSHYLNGVNALNASVAAGFARELQVQVSEFSPRLAEEIALLATAAEHGNVAPAPQPRREPREYPLISWVAAGEACESSVCYPQGIADTWLSSTENAGEGAYWLTVRGHSMTRDVQPSFPEGTYILVRKDFDLVSGKYYIARNLKGRGGDADDSVTFKQYVQDAGIGYLVPLNPQYQTVPMDGTWEIIGRVIDAKIPGL